VALVAAVALAFNFLLGYGIPGVVAALVLSLGLAFFSYFNSDKVALRISRARPADGPEFARFHNLVEGLCIAGGLPKPRLYVVDDPAPNAFATGRNPKHAALAVTTGLLERMNRVELEGVVAHELSHIKNYDMLVSTVAVVAVGAVVLLSDIGLRMTLFGGGRRSGNDNGGGGGNGITALIGLFALSFIVLAPLFATLMNRAVSRRREFLADASGVQLTRYPPGLVSALEKLRDDPTVVRTAGRATAQLWIESPLDREEGHKGSRLNRMFDTHPPLAERIRVLKEM